MRSQNKPFYLLYFLVAPFYTLVYYLYNFRKPHAKDVMWLFVIFFGATFAVGAESQNADIVAYIGDIKILNSLNPNIDQALKYFFDSNEADIMRTVLALIVSQFTNNGYYLVIIFGVIFGYFYSRNMWFVLDRLNGKINFFTFIMLFCFFLIVPIWDLNGFRFWTAAHMFLFGLLPFLFEGKKKSLIWCFITPFLMHFSFLIALIPLVIYLVIGNKVKFYFFIFIFTLFVSEFNINEFNNVIEANAPSILVKKSSPYRGLENVEQLREGDSLNSLVWYVKYYSLGLKWSLISLLIIIYWTSRKTVKSDKRMLSLLSFIFLFFAFANLLSTIPSGGRFLALANLITLSFLIIHLKYYLSNKAVYTISKIVTPFIIFFIIISLRFGWYSFSVMTIIGNPISAIFTIGENASLNDIIKGL